MIHGYRIIQNWDQWLTHHFLGNSLLKDEQKLLSHLLQRHYGKHALLIGVPKQHELLQAMDIPCHSLLSPILSRENNAVTIESDFRELPIMTGSIDLVMLPHTLEFIDNPRNLLNEACRIVKPEGLIAICGFNPYSAWGIKNHPWKGNLIQANKIKGWLRLSDFALEHLKYALFRPPINNAKYYQKLQFMEYIGNKCFPMLGGIYILIARAKVIPLTPIRMKWKQQLNGIRISTFSGHIARQSK